MNRQVEINSRDFNHELKKGVRVRIPTHNCYDSSSTVEISYLNRDAESFWGLSVQHGGLVSYAHCACTLILD